MPSPWGSSEPACPERQDARPPGSQPDEFRALLEFTAHITLRLVTAALWFLKGVDFSLFSAYDVNDDSHRGFLVSAEKLDTQIRQEQIAQATLEVIATKGLAKVSVAAVAKRVGVVPSALYRHFKGKDEVLDAAMEMILGRLLENVDAVRADPGTPLDHLKRLLDRHIRMVRKNRGIPQILLSQDFYAHRPDRRRRVYDGIQAYLARVASLVREAQRVGQADPDLDAESLSVVFLGLIQPPAILWHMSNGTFDVTRQAQRAWPLFLKAIQDGAASPPGKAGKGREGERK